MWRYIEIVLIRTGPFLKAPLLIIKHQLFTGEVSVGRKLLSRLGSFQRNNVYRHDRLFINFTHRDQCMRFKQPPDRLMLNIKHFNLSGATSFSWRAGQMSFITARNLKQTHQCCLKLDLVVHKSCADIKTLNSVKSEFNRNSCIVLIISLKKMANISEYDSFYLAMTI